MKELLALIAEGERGENVLRLIDVPEENLREAEQKMEELSAFRDSLLYYYRWRFDKEDQG